MLKFMILHEVCHCINTANVCSLLSYFALIHQAEGRKYANADGVVANVRPFDWHLVLPVLQELDSKAKEKGGCGRLERISAGPPEAECRQES